MAQADDIRALHEEVERLWVVVKGLADLKEFVVQPEHRKPTWRETLQAVGTFIAALGVFLTPIVVVLLR